jgi:hypothetical protein
MKTLTVRSFVLLACLLLLAPVAHAQNSLFDNTNGSGVQNGARQSPVIRLSQPAHIAQIITYHWNNGRGDPPGTLALRAANGQTYGPFPAQGSSGQGGAPNVNWTANANVNVPAGTYTVIDSKPQSWSFNQQSGNAGFVKVYGSLQTAAAPPGPGPQPPAGPKPCFVNSGALAAMGPCSGPANTTITIQVLRQIKAPIRMVVFKPYQAALPGATGAQITVRQVNGSGLTAGSLYTFPAPAQLCVGRSNSSWDAFPQDSNGQLLGDIGRYTITGCP